jgi:hypothetical protein
MQSDVNVPNFDPFSNGTFQQYQALFMEGIKQNISNVEKIKELENELKFKDELIKDLCIQLKKLEQKKK